MRLIGLAVVLALSLLAAPLAPEAQQAGKIARIGVLGSGALLDSRQPYIVALQQELRVLGYADGQNVAFEIRSAEGRPERLPGLAAELVRLGVDVILAQSNPAIAAAQKATASIPIVMMIASDPVASGFVASIPRPGGNITGLSIQGADLPSKALQLLKDVVPNRSRVAVLWDPGFPGGRQQLSDVKAAAVTLGLQLQVVEVRTPDELDDAFAAAITNRAGAAFNLGSPMLGRLAPRIAELAARHRMPTMCGLLREYMVTGCLLVYGPSVADQYKRAAYFADRILKGAKPADLPIEQPTKFYLVINLQSAKALGLTIPQPLLLRADQVIE
jgi:putative ABC transport system substrate-binding protein